MSNGLRAKPAREVRAGDKLHIENDAGIFEVDVLEVSGIRGPAAVAHTLYRETDCEPRGASPADRRTQSHAAIRAAAGAQALQARPPAHHSVPRPNLKRSTRTKARHKSGLSLLTTQQILRYAISRLTFSSITSWGT